MKWQFLRSKKQKGQRSVLTKSMKSRQSLLWKWFVFSLLVSHMHTKRKENHAVFLWLFFSQSLARNSFKNNKWKKLENCKMFFLFRATSSRNRIWKVGFRKSKFCSSFFYFFWTILKSNSQTFHAMSKSLLLLCLAKVPLIFC